MSNDEIYTPSADELQEAIRIVLLKASQANASDIRKELEAKHPTWKIQALRLRKFIRRARTELDVADDPSSSMSTSIVEDDANFIFGKGSGDLSGNSGGGGIRGAIKQAGRLLSPLTSRQRPKASETRSEIRQLLESVKSPAVPTEIQVETQPELLADVLQVAETQPEKLSEAQFSMQSTILAEVFKERSELECSNGDQLKKHKSQENENLQPILEVSRDAIIINDTVKKSAEHVVVKRDIFVDDNDGKKESGPCKPCEGCVIV